MYSLNARKREKKKKKNNWNKYSQNFQRRLILSKKGCDGKVKNIHLRLGKVKSLKIKHFCLNNVALAMGISSSFEEKMSYHKFYLH